MNTNPKRGPYHPKAPSKLVWKIIRGMLPHKTARGQAALGRLKVFDGVPTPYDTMKRQVIPPCPPRCPSSVSLCSHNIGVHASSLCVCV